MGDAFRFGEVPPPGTNEEDFRALTDWLADDTASRPAAPASAQQPNAPLPFPTGLLPPAAADTTPWGAPPSLHVPPPGATAAHPGSGDACSPSTTAWPDTTQGSGNSAPAGRSGRSNTASGDTDEKRRVREKNKHAQKRYREKQRDKMTEMESRVEMLRAQLERVGAESAALQRRNQVLSKLVELKQTHIATLTDVVKANDQRQREGADAVPPPAAAVTAAAGLSPITIEQCRRMQHTEIVARWRAYAERMASLLIEAEMPNPTQDCMDRLHEVGAETWSFAQTIALSKPMALKLLLVSNLQTGRWDDPRKNDEAFWRAAVAPMQLEQGQQEQMLYVASMFMTSMAQIDVQHGELSRRVLELLPQASGKRRYVSIVKLAETMLSVQQTLTRSDQEGTTFASITLSEILTPLQFARFATQAYPLFPNPLQIIKLLAADMSEQERARMASASHGIDVAAIYKFADVTCERIAG